MVKIFFSGKRKKKRNDKRCTIPVTALLRKRPRYVYCPNFFHTLIAGQRNLIILWLQAIALFLCDRQHRTTNRLSFMPVHFIKIYYFLPLQAGTLSV